MLARAHADRQRTAGPRADHAMRLALRNDGDRVGAGQFLHRAAHRVEQAALVEAVHQVRDHLRVGLGVEDIALGFEPGAQFVMVLDDAVMHQRDLAAREDRVRVAGDRRTVRRPARVRDAGLRRELFLFDLKRKIGNPSNAAQPFQSVVGKRRDAAGVVAAIFQAPEAFHQHRQDVAPGRRADDSAHGYFARAVFLRGGVQRGSDTCLARATVSWPGGVSLLMVEPAPM